ncbi:uncharacterized protein APUU_31730A [Aspergillus puulaauensis]|uniref:Fungal-specific transcription factor domain-containing protein n=1 Tax=Aspergillus puulaauensis TaxID=1220207 RepID=A0A7R7XLB8_9EURO|nr:uncharacterized protein APUU_31730A [Aspergillus puulaauensis]BCS23505.1 hypothetical protein APUU_31730A [Aspergillus puulaauensis]
MVTVFAVPSCPILRRLLAHFTEGSALWMSISPRRHKRFLHHFVSTAVGSPLTMSCVLAVAAADLLKYETREPDMRMISLDLYGKAVAGVRSEIDNELACEQDRPLSDDIVLAILLLCLHETHNFSDTSRLLPHLNAAAFLLQQRLSSAPSNGHLRTFLLELFSYFFALTAFSHGPSLALTPAGEVFDMISANPHHQLGQGMLLGPSQALITTIFQVTRFVMRAPSMMYGMFRLELAIIEHQLQNPRNLTDLATAELEQPHYQARINTVYSPDDEILFEIYRLSCLVYVKQILDPDVHPCNHELQHLVNSFVNELNALEGDSPLNGILTWPLLVVGLCAVTRPQQNLIMARLRKSHKIWRTDIFTTTMDFLRQRWSLLATEMGPQQHKGTQQAMFQYNCRGSPGSHHTFESLPLPIVLV